MSDIHSAEYLNKQVLKLLHRIERHMVPSNQILVSNVGGRISTLSKKVSRNEFLRDLELPKSTALNAAKLNSNAPTRGTAEQIASKTATANLKRVSWDALYDAIIFAISDGSPDNFMVPASVQEEIETERRCQEVEEMKLIGKSKLARFQSCNGQPILSGPWRKKPFSRRQYEHIKDYVFTNAISSDEAASLKPFLFSALDGFLGQAYNYDDHNLTEEWMCSYEDSIANGPSDDEVIRTQLESLMDIMCAQVTDRFCNSTGVLKRPVLELDRMTNAGETATVDPVKDEVDYPKYNINILKETPVWGIDSYTRRMIELALQEGLPTIECEFNEFRAHRFIEQVILPTINSLAPELAHNMKNVLSSIVYSPTSSDMDRIYASVVLQTVEEFGIDEFRIHPKGTGVICIDKDGIPPHVVVAEYLGEIYPPYRWCERIEVVQQAQKEFDLKPSLPDFYNILLERPRHDPNGYGLFYVDASQKANHGSSCSHSCNANCQSAVVAKNGKLVIVLTTLRHVHYGEELTMDYNSVTSSDIEWRSAICLCGMSSCRGSFLHYATQDDLQQVINKNCGPLTRYASLLRACAAKTITPDDQQALDRHGIKLAAMGNNVPNFISKYVADCLRFAEFERKALPCKLMRPKDKDTLSLYTFSAADMEARCIMEQRIQSLVCTISLVKRVIEKQPETLIGGEKAVKSPLQIIPTQQAIAIIVGYLWTIPSLLTSFIGHLESDSTKSTSSVKRKSSKLDENSTAHLMYAIPSKAKLSDVLNDVKNAISNIEETLPAKDIFSCLKDGIPVQLEGKPIGLSWMKALCLAIREVLIPIQQYSCPGARLRLLCDVLVLWANTSNFSTYERYEPVESDPIIVPARELGTNIPRSKIFKQEVVSSRLKEMKVNPSKERTSPAAAYRTAAALAVAAEIAAATASAAAVASSAALTMVEEAEVSEQVATTPTASDEEEIVLVELSGTKRKATQQDEPSDIEGSVHCVSDSDCVSGLLVPSSPTVTTESLNISVISSHTTDEETSSEDADSIEQSDVCIDSSVSLGSTDNNTANSCRGKAVSTSVAPRFNSYLDPNEPVFTGTKNYYPEFIFWQLMCWFDAGTDEVVKAPDLLGCVQLPLPSMCFGEAEGQYSDAERAILLNHLKDERAHILPWPKPVQRCFSLRNAFLDDSLVLLGTPMLDTALGLVGATKTALKYLGSNTEAKVSLRQSRRERDEQLDNILAPETNTEWVQCEKCSKWRRIAWYIQADSLPENWECSLNTWDVEAASCDTPQDSFDPISESTVKFSSNSGSAGDVLDSNGVALNFKVGEYFDVYCEKNQVFYEAKVVAIKNKPQGNSSNTPERLIKFHFKGWKATFDEWISETSDRICQLHTHTLPDVRNAREQERWQGFDIEEEAAVPSTKKQKQEPVLAKLTSVAEITPMKKPSRSKGSDKKSSSEKKRIPELAKTSQSTEKEDIPPIGCKILFCKGTTTLGVIEDFDLSVMSSF